MINQLVNNIANRLSLRIPQHESLEILDRICQLLPINEQSDIETSLAAIKKEFSTVTDFEREFPSLCFALATGVGKTRLMGAFISYLHLAYDIKNFFILAPNLTIYNKRSHSLHIKKFKNWRIILKKYQLYHISHHQKFKQECAKQLLENINLNN
ncbi:DEAD/DEAH box helicase family protein [Dolichospermum sp. ST_sed9]|jgi:hypothetical protein|nr:DEAD/DEAH box helicase family protein [Dolichospermum sp. ST_sed9]